MDFIGNENLKLMYRELMAKEEERLSLLSHLLSQTSEMLEQRDVRRLGDILRDYLDHKSLLDHYFLEAPLNDCGYSESEIKAEIERLNSLTSCSI